MMKELPGEEQQSQEEVSKQKNTENAQVINTAPDILLSLLIQQKDQESFWKASSKHSDL
jgi:hypothetical protein